MNADRTTLERWLGLVVRYWAANMTLIHNRGSNWPGFGYSESEKEELRAIAAKVTQSQFYSFAAFNTVIAIAAFAGVVVAGMYCLMGAIGGEQNMPNTPASLFFLSLALEVVVCLAIVLPISMILSSALAGRMYGIANEDLPDLATTARFFHKMWFQITRMSVLMVCAVLPLWIFVPNDSKFMAAIRLIVPLLSPVVSVLTTVYYFSAKLRQTGESSN